MTIRIDDRIGSREFAPLLTRLGAPTRIGRMASGDFRFWGHGPTGRVRVGIERKTVDEITAIFGADAVGRRFIGKQLPLLVQTYPEFPVLIIEGYAVPDPETLTVTKGKHRTYGRQLSYLAYAQLQLSLMFKARLTIVPTKSRLETAFWLRALYAWFEKPWTSHKSYLGLSGVRLPGDPNLLEPRSELREFANGIPGVGWDRSARIERYFRSPCEMVTASAEEWQTALGYKKGMKQARAIHAWCHRMRGE